MEELALDGKKYLSSKQAAKITGYAKDYVGQLCREGRVEARLVGRSWYVSEDSISKHRFGQENTSSVGTPTYGHSNSSESEKKRGQGHETGSINYTAEEITPVQTVSNEQPELHNAQEKVGSVEPEARGISAMQDTWSEWFSKAHHHNVNEMPDNESADHSAEQAQVAGNTNETKDIPDDTAHGVREVVSINRLGSLPQNETVAMHDGSHREAIHHTTLRGNEFEPSRGRGHEVVPVSLYQSVPATTASVYAIPSTKRSRKRRRGHRVVNVALLLVAFVIGSVVVAGFFAGAHGYGNSTNAFWASVDYLGGTRTFNAE